MNMQMNGAFLKEFGYLASFFFLITGIAIALHHHDIPINMAGCKICKVKISFTTPSKAVVDSTLAAAASFARFMAMLPVTPERTGPKASRLPSSFALLLYSNKSPPVHPV
jgi:disulfide bond formation protein DsbB